MPIFFLEGTPTFYALGGKPMEKLLSPLIKI
jgi:hypothetical protein